MIERIHKRQDGHSYISGKSIDLKTHEVEIYHTVSLDRRGIDNESNWRLVFKSENQSKGTKNLQLMRYIYRFRKHKDMSQVRGTLHLEMHRKNFIPTETLYQ